MGRIANLCKSNRLLAFAKVDTRLDRKVFAVATRMYQQNVFDNDVGRVDRDVRRIC